MFAIIGIVVVFGAVVGGYLMEKGHLGVLLQPAELLIIAGAAAGTVLIANPLHILKEILKGIIGAFGTSRFTQARYLESLKMLYELFDQARRGGLASLEAEVDNPEKGKTFTAHPAILKDHHVCAFICDTFRTMMVGGMEPFDLDQMLESDLDVHHHDATEPVSALTTTADSLPGLGIVAAVLGVVITMGALGGPPEQIGEKVAAALVGTFLGILLCYGLVGPLAASMGKEADAERAYLQVLRVAMSAFNKGIPPILAVEVGRRAIPGHVRPKFQEVESTCRNRAPQAPPAEAAA
ncbi:MAG: flagellar motor stator protein MotA [Acidobacteriia bacterium]|nr:flagellar motor stator protein MotA [Terriglobia bacterium]